MPINRSQPAFAISKVSLQFSPPLPAPSPDPSTHTHTHHQFADFADSRAKNFVEQKRADKLCRCIDGKRRRRRRGEMSCLTLASKKICSLASCWSRPMCVCVGDFGTCVCVCVCLCLCPISPWGRIKVVPCACLCVCVWARASCKLYFPLLLPIFIVYLNWEP